MITREQLNAWLKKNQFASTDTASAILELLLNEEIQLSELKERILTESTS